MPFDGNQTRRTSTKQDEIQCVAKCGKRVRYRHRRYDQIQNGSSPIARFTAPNLCESMEPGEFGPRQY